jgi:hypothetical protein
MVLARNNTLQQHVRILRDFMELKFSTRDYPLVKFKARLRRKMEIHQVMFGLVEQQILTMLQQQRDF